MRDSPRIYWLNADDAHEHRAHMETLLGTSAATSVRVPVKGAYSHFLGNTVRANTLGHVRALRQIATDARSGTRTGCNVAGEEGQVAFVAEDDLSLEYAPWWTVDLHDVVARAPADWGVLQLAFTSHSPHTRTLVERAHNGPTPPTKPFRLTNDYYVERSILHAAEAPYIPWPTFRTSSTTFYAVHPRGYQKILEHVRAYKTDPDYPRTRLPPGDALAPSTHFHPDHPPEHLFALATSYTYHVPLLTTERHARRFVYRYGRETSASDPRGMPHARRPYGDAWTARRRVDEVVRYWKGHAASARI